MVNCAIKEEATRKRILVIDDEKGFAELFRINLQRTGPYEVRCETDSGRAMQTAHRFHPDLIFLDIVMPGKDGGEIAAALHRDPELKAVPVVFVTALLDNRETGGKIVTNRKGEQMMGKPVSMDTVNECLNRNLYGEDRETQ